MNSPFFAVLSRMKYINRWALMRNTFSENLSEHSLEVAMIGHALATLGNTRLGKNINADRVALIGIFHDCPEIITGDMPTPIKYHNEDIQHAFKDIEDSASGMLVSMLPEDMREIYEPLFFKKEGDDYLWKLCKAADRLSALIKCIDEEKAGNTEFSGAKEGIIERLHEMKLPEVELFEQEFLNAYYLTLDEQRSMCKKI